MARKQAKKTKKNAGPGNPAKRAAKAELDQRLAPGDQRVLAEFTVWAQGQEEISAPSVELGTKGLNGLLSSVRADGHNPTDIQAVPALVNVSFAKGDAAEQEQPGLGMQVASACFGVLGDYLRFREETSPEPETWLAARATAQDMIDERFGYAPLTEGFEDPGDLEEHLESAAQLAETAVDDARRTEATVAVVSLSRIGEMLTWIGSGRDTDRSGEPQEADRAQVWDFMGRTGEPDVPALTAWWDNLVTSEVIHVAGGRVMLGPAGTQWTSASGPSADSVENVAQGLIAETVSMSCERSGRTEAIDLLGWTIAPALPSTFDPTVLIAASNQALQDPDEASLKAIAEAFEHLLRLGFVEGTQDAPVVAEALRVVVARGLRLGMIYTRLDEEDLFADDDPEGLGEA